MTQTIGVIGAGQMGAGIAQVSAQAGYRVLLSDVSAEVAGKGRDGIAKVLGRLVDKQKIAAADRDAALARIEPVGSLEPMADAAIVIEAATEREEVKRNIFAAIGKVMGGEAILASNTSSLSITRLAQSSPDPARFVGVHFFNPVPLMPLVEVIRGLATSNATVAAVASYAQALGKQVVHANDSPCFIVNRILLPMINEAIYVLYEGVGSVDSIDLAMKLGANHPMGPLQLADFIGLDVCLSVMQVLHDGLADTKYRPCPLLVKYVEAGWLGRKARRGFYDYRGEVPVPTR